MKAMIKRASRDVHTQALPDFIFNQAAQVALLGMQFQWTADTQVGPLAPAVRCCPPGGTSGWRRGHLQRKGVFPQNDVAPLYSAHRPLCTLPRPTRPP